jgi:imidazolonepropionase-like amidohydrolase
MVKAIVEEAHKRGKHIASHVSNADDLAMRIRVGIDSMEHLGGTTGGRYSQESLDLLVESRVAVVPTLNVGLVYKETEEFPERLEDPEALRFFPADLADIIRRSTRDFSHLRYFDGAKVQNSGGTQARFKQLLDAGVRILMGTEAGTPLNFHSSAAAREMVWMNRLGMTPMQVIIASTRGPAQFLRMDRKYGSIEVGKIADIIAVDGNPLHDMGVMHRVSVVIKDGIVHKGDAAAPKTSSTSSASSRH